MAKIKKSAMAAGFLVSTAVISGCGQQESLAEPAAAHVEPVMRLTSCDDLLADKWAAPEDAEPNISWDPATGKAEIELTDTVGVSVNVYDAACPKVDFIGPIIARMITDDAQAKAEECTDAVAMILKGEVPRKGDIVGDADALRRHVTSYCPPSFEKQLQAVGK
ncbi:hypothetical protein ACIRN4_07015 [Pimelobacter simplex]|uniref:hypothetical protein n=1 Tax=Nocardioides simplex TaxID=2045 RepID=UPI0037F11F3A